MLAVTDKLISLTKTHSLLAAFYSFPDITVEEWQKMSMSSRTSRISAFKAYVNNLELINIDATQTNNVFRASDVVPGDAIEKWLLLTGYWNDEGVWDDKGRWLAQ